MLRLLFLSYQTAPAVKQKQGPPSCAGAVLRTGTWWSSARRALPVACCIKLCPPVPA